MGPSASVFFIGLSLYGSLLAVCGTTQVRPLYAPKFISNWTSMDTVNTTEQIYEHGFNENPIKAEVQVRQTPGGMIFPGIKSANVISTWHGWVRAGVLCMYNKTHVRIMAAPNRGNMDNYLIYTGNQHWIESGHNVYARSGQVRVRVWHKDDMPTADFIHSNITMTSADYNYHKIKHNITTDAMHAHVNVQLMFKDGWIAEAQGSESHFYVNWTPGWSGVVYGVSKDDIQLWAPSKNTNGLVYTYYGWGQCTNIANCSYKSVNISISMWEKSCVNHPVHFEHHKVSRRFAHAISVTFNVDKDILGVTAAVTDHRPTNGKKYAFPGTGTAMMDNSNHWIGLVYGYTNNSVIRIWHPWTPNYKHNYIVKVGESPSPNKVWATEADIKACVWKATPRPQPASTTERPKSTTNTTTSSTAIAQTTKTAAVSTSSTKITPTMKAATVSTSISTSNPTSSQAPQHVTVSNTTKSSPDDNVTLCVGRADSPRQCLDLGELGQNVFIDFSQIGRGYIMFMCKNGYKYESGSVNRTINVTTENITLSDQPLVCTERNPLQTKAEIEARVQELVKKLTIPANSTSKHRRALESARDLRVASRVIGVVSGTMIGGLILLVVMNDVARFIRYMCTR